MRKFHKVLFMMLVVSSLSACMATTPDANLEPKRIEALMKRAPEEMSCAKENIDVKLMDGETKEKKLYSLSGCGTRATYTVVCGKEEGSSAAGTLFGSGLSSMVNGITCKAYSGDNVPAVIQNITTTPSYRSSSTPYQSTIPPYQSPRRY